MSGVVARHIWADEAEVVLDEDIDYALTLEPRTGAITVRGGRNVSITYTTAPRRGPDG